MTNRDTNKSGESKHGQSQGQGANKGGNQQGQDRSKQQQTGRGSDKSTTDTRR